MSDNAGRPDMDARNRSPRAAGFALGFGLGGFFDGILLHQVLQWHHLLSGVDRARDDLLFLILTDGLFHALMYLVTGLGLFLLWRARSGLARDGSGTVLMSSVLLGFGTWHIVDTVLSHWLLGIHRVRMDVDQPLLWDLLWLALFGLAPLILAWRGWKRQAAPPSRLACSPVALVATVLAAGLWAAAPAGPPGQTAVVFRPGVSPAEALAGMQALNGRLLWADATSQLWIMVLPPDADRIRLYRHGALLVSDAGLPLGCLDWLQAA